jgi:hypothetical protein
MMVAKRKKKSKIEPQGETGIRSAREATIL